MANKRNRDCLDLTLSSDEAEDQSRVKMRRTAPEDDVEIVKVCSSTAGPSRPRREAPRGIPVPGAAPAGASHTGDADIEITYAVGQVTLRDLPHPRPDCARHALALTDSTTNVRHCPQCFCHVCDIKASECTMWGTGAVERDHCNARKTGSWNQRRERYRINPMHEQHVREVDETHVQLSDQMPQEWQDQLQRTMSLLLHACGCSDCASKSCRRVRQLFQHAKQCQVKVTGGCQNCEKMWCLLNLHAKSCTKPDCPVPRCRELKEMRRQQSVARQEGQQRTG